MWCSVVNLNNTILLAANTARTNAYAQALKNAGIYLKAGIFFDEKSSPKLGYTERPIKGNWANPPVYLPDLSLAVTDSVRGVCGELIKVNSGNVNNPLVKEAIKKVKPEMIIYSGYGSQIIGSHILSLCPEILHLHSGWLPEFRGSTTIYYHLLETGNCAVSALLLNESIDKGPILARGCYPRPPSGVDIDYLYDGAIRADMLVKVLSFYGENGVLPPLKEQSKNQGNAYYIIHPILKHIAILSLGVEI